MLSISNHLILSAIWDKSAHLHEYYYHNNYPATSQTKRQMRTIGASCFRDSSWVIYMNKLEHEYMNYQFHLMCMANFTSC